MSIFIKKNEFCRHLINCIEVLNKIFMYFLFLICITFIDDAFTLSKKEQTIKKN